VKCVAPKIRKRLTLVKRSLAALRKEIAKIPRDLKDIEFRIMAKEDVK